MLNLTGTYIALILLFILGSVYLSIRIKDGSERDQIKELILKSKIKRAFEPSIYLELVALFTIGVLGMYVAFTTLNQSEILFYFTVLLPFILIPLTSIFLTRLRKNKDKNTGKMYYFILSLLILIIFIIIFYINYDSSVNNLLYDGFMWILAIIMTFGAEHLYNII